MADEEEEDAVTKSQYRWRKTQWKNLRVGDVIYLSNDEGMPADILLLSSSEPDCIAYVETKNLDGETNLKLKQGPVETAWLQTPEDCATKLKLVIESEPPSTNLLRYQATLNLVQDPAVNLEVSPTSPNSKGGLPTMNKRPASPLPKDESDVTNTSNSTIESSIKRIPVDLGALLHRGAVLRNTKWAIGVVVFTGEDTKQIMNSGKTPSKRSRVEKLMNPHVYVAYPSNRYSIPIARPTCSS